MNNKKVTSIALPQSTHAKVARFNPLKLKIIGEVSTYNFLNQKIDLSNKI